jgi:hypothetical protein
MRIFGRGIAVACLLGASPTFAEQPQFSGERIKADVSFLADDLLEGRLTGTRGYELAARFVANRFAMLSLTPGNNGSWFQQVPFAEAKRREDAPSYIRIGGAEFRNGEDVVMFPSNAFLDQSIDAEVVFVGYGLEAPELGLNDYAGRDVRGKIAIALSGFPPGSPSEMAAHLSSEKSRMAQEHGAIGLLTVTTPTREKVTPWEVYKTRFDNPSVNWIGNDGLPYLSAPKIQINGSLGPKAAAALFAGAKTPLPALLAASERKGARIKGFGLKPKLHIERHSVSQHITGPNVIGILRGGDPTLVDEYIVLSAHLDHLGIVKSKNGDSIANGATDNALGVSTMLEAARAFVDSGQRPRRSILFVALTGEEKGLLGAEYLANHPVVGNGKIVGLVNLDGPVLTYDFEDMIAFGAEHSTISHAVARATASEGVRLTPDPAPEQNYFVRSDH